MPVSVLPMSDPSARDQIKTFCSTGQVFTSSGTQQNNVPYKLVILDEADAMTSTAQMAIRRVIERYTANTRFCLIANYVHRLSPALLSRCTRFRFGPLKGENIRQLLEHVVQTEDVAIDEPALDTVATLSGGDLRRALNILQACHASTSVPASTTDDSDPAAVGDRVVIRPAMIYDCVAAPHPQDVKQIWQMLYNCQNLLDAYSAMTSVMSTKGIALPDLLTALMDEIMQLDISPHARVTWIEEFANIEYRVSTGGSESLQATAVMGIISKGVSLLAERK